ncbi:hypothetical protein GQ53DRAFT_765372 [Thozetella sp. PMI_491]|nr:hypothetical protein GQ53DRAFT_765372 [Thozetella sp. PMI_491]
MRVAQVLNPFANGLILAGISTYFFAGHTSAGHGDAGGSGCTFSISSTGGIACPAGQLSDGQIRLNGTEPTAEFTINDGQITDASGRGCIVTDAPTTQYQCDEGKSPVSRFAIGADNTLSYNGNSKFWVCPATDTEYNVYIDPDFGQTKCFPVGLTASGCGARIPSCSAVWQTTTYTVAVPVTEVSTVTVTENTSVTSAKVFYCDVWRSPCTGQTICNLDLEDTTRQRSSVADEFATMVHAHDPFDPPRSKKAIRIRAS